MTPRSLAFARVLTSLLLFAVVLGFARPCCARIAAKHGDIVQTGIRGLISTNGVTGFGHPTELRSDREVFVIYYAGAAYNCVILLGRPDVDPKSLARVLDKAVVGTELAKNPVDWEAAGDYSAAQVAFSRGKIMSRSSSAVAPFGRVVAGIRASGLKPYAIIRIPGYASARVMKLPVYRAKHTWYDISNAPAGLSIRVSSAMPGSVTLRMLALAFFVPAVTLTSFIAALIFARSSRIPIATRRRHYTKFALYPTFAAIALHMPFSFAFIRSTALRQVADLWFGTTRGTAFAPLMMAPVIVLFLFVPVTRLAERKLFGPAEGDDVVKPQVSPEEKHTRKQVALISLAPLALGWALVFANDIIAPSGSTPSFVLEAIGFSLIIGGPGLVQMLFRKRIAQFEKETTEDDLTARAQSMAKQMGTELRQVVIDDSAGGAAYASAAMLPRGKMRISRKLLEVLSTDEMDFVLAHELAHRMRRDVPKMVALFVIGMVLFQAPLIATATWRLSFGAWLFSLPVMGMAMLFGGIQWLSRRREREADRIALGMTRDFRAAESALIKLTKHSPMPYMHEVDDFSTHPKISKRIAALRKQAEELGLETLPTINA